ncbi:type II toxin-antitoxin system Phd/YefM family antitoxin [Deferribacterales bacterium Es71-Z0220]|uniref:type II toxin-antitoxin system prevent-host-death family antitoxin n=1 Tax=Deferrivibrio essentukiensis TaxID=2880922 RepID=UPI001F6105C7|nr:type II toxin-antitoxin system Phd/YefM family antitoxin [Deferrivibrio essentukiensis]
MIISANQLKQRGISLINELAQKFDEIIVSFRGKNKYVIMDIERYEKLRESEIELAYQKALKDIENKKFHSDIENHLENISK